MTVIGLRLSGILRIFFQLFIVSIGLFSLPSSLKPASSAAAQNPCPHIPTGGTSDNSVWVSSELNGSNSVESSGSLPSTAQKVYIHATANADGSCQPRSFIGGTCVNLTPTEYKVSVIETHYTYYPLGSGSPVTGGGAVYGKASCPNGSTKDYHYLSTVNNCTSNPGASEPSTGPIQIGYVPLQAGLYRVKSRGKMISTSCNFPTETSYKYADYFSSGELNLGCTECTTSGTAPTNSGKGGSTVLTPTMPTSYNGGEGGNTSVGEPVNVINGNMYLDQTDLELPGLGPGLRITRAYNSATNRIGAFGESWTSNLEAQALHVGPDHFFLRWGDGSGTFFKRSGNTNEFLPLSRRNWFAYGVKLPDNTYQVFAKGGLIYQFNGPGSLIAIKDRNNNQTTITRNINNQRVEAVTDAEGRSVNFTYHGANDTSR